MPAERATIPLVDLQILVGAPMTTIQSSLLRGDPGVDVERSFARVSYLARRVWCSTGQRQFRVRRSITLSQQPIARANHSSKWWRRLERLLWSQIVAFWFDLISNLNWSDICIPILATLC